MGGLPGVPLNKVLTGQAGSVCFLVLGILPRSWLQSFKEMTCLKSGMVICFCTQCRTNIKPTRLKKQDSV